MRLVEYAVSKAIFASDVMVWNLVRCFKEDAASSWRGGGWGRLALSLRVLFEISPEMH
jgi:hypothetical protein